MKKEYPKVETPEDWEKAKNFIPKKDQIIIYDGIKENGHYVTLPRLKIGDGVTKVNDLPFAPNTIEVAYTPNSGILIID